MPTNSCFRVNRLPYHHNHCNVLHNSRTHVSYIRFMGQHMITGGSPSTTSSVAPLLLRLWERESERCLRSQERCQQIISHFETSLFTSGILLVQSKPNKQLHHLDILPLQTRAYMEELDKIDFLKNIKN